MENQKQFDTLDIFMYLWKKRKPIIIVTVSGAILSIIISLIMPDYYKSETTLFPTTFISPATSSVRNVNQETDPLVIGNEDDLEMMIQLLKSDYISDRIIDNFELVKHYGISDNDPHLRTLVKDTYYSNISFSKTPFQGVVISVSDTDPIKSAEIANGIAGLLDTLVFDMQKQRTKEIYKVVEGSYHSEQNYLKELEDSLDIYRQLGILDYFKEVDRYSEAYGKALGNNTLTNKGEKKINAKFELLKKYGKQFYSLTGLINSQKNKVISLHHGLVVSEQNIKQPMTHKFTISKAQASDKKDSPKRLFIVIFSTLGAFIVSIGTILFLDFFKELRIRIKKETK